MTSDKINQLFLDKLESSGLDLNAAKTLGIKYLSAVETKELVGGAGQCPSLYIPYYNPQANGPMRFVSGYEPFFRIRYLGERLPIDKDGKPQRYRQGTKGVCAYFPQNQDWTSILQESSERLFITEGEFKAAKACKEGLPTIGLGGIDSFQSSKFFLELLPELKEINWSERLVYIMYDSDIGTNESSVEAVNRLGRRLADRGAIPFFLSLPDSPDLNKTGIDDYLVRNSMEQFHSEVMPTAMHLTAAEKVWEMNQRYIKISNPPGVYERLTHQLLSFSDFTKINSARIPVFHKLAVSKNDGRQRMASDLKDACSEW
ncbi:MAG: DUF3854 domain-containing protein, partial [Parabacteroides sp.]|nr:DUF3854 domain-containing protein [Parabacteroides sp.]